MKKIIFIALLFSIKQVNAQTPSWAWAKGAGGNLGQLNINNYCTYGNNLITDINGSVYTTGYFQTPTMVVGNYTLTNANSSGNYGDIFIIKYDATGNVLWAKSAKGDSSDNALGIFIDAASNIYITGSFASPTITFDTKILTNTNNGTNDIFIAKYNAGGNIIWAKSYGGNSNDWGNAVNVDAMNNLYITGTFQSQSFSIGTNTLTIDVIGNNDMFIAKFDSSCTPLYAKSVGDGCSIAIQGNNITSDGSNNIYVTGSFGEAKIAIGNDTLLCNSGSDNYFLAKYDVSGNFLWAKSGEGLNYDVAANSVSLDAIGNPYITGTFAGSSLKIGNDTLVASCCYTGFIAKYSSTGNALWARNLLTNTPQAWSYACITVDQNYGVYVGGNFINQVNNLPPLVFGNDTLINDNPGAGGAIFIAKYDSSGNALWGKTASSTRWNSLAGITTDRYNNIFSIGYYVSPTIVFDSDTLFNLNHSNVYYNADYFVAKIGSNGVGIKQYIGNNAQIAVYPNPSNGNISITSSNNIDEIKIADMLGQTIYEAKPIAANTTLILNNTGVYFISITTGAETSTKKVIVNK